MGRARLAVTLSYLQISGEAGALDEGLTEVRQVLSPASVAQVINLMETLAAQDEQE